MNSAYRRIELPGHVGEIGGERAAPADQHIIVAGDKRRSGGQPNHFAQPPAHAVALNRIADLARYRESDPDRSAVAVVLGALPRLYDEGAGRRSCALRGSLKVRAALQPFHWFGFGCDFGLDHCGLDLEIGVWNEDSRPIEGLDCYIEQGLIRKPVPTFRDHALGTQLLAPLTAPQRQNPAAALGRHAGAKAVAALTHQFARLVGPFHRKISAGGLMRP
jgi:hypothetical protein